MATTVSITRTPVTVTFSGAQGPSGAVSGTPNHITFAASPTSVPTTEGTVSWNSDDKTLDIQTEVSATRIQVGQEQVIRVRNTTGSSIEDGSVVYITGASGQRATVAKALATNETRSKSTIGVVTSAISNNSTGYVTTEGLVRGVDTSAFAEGDELFLSAATAGAITATPPSSPNHVVRVGWCVVSGVNGTLLIHPHRKSVMSADVTDATDLATASKVVKRDANGDARFRFVRGSLVYEHGAIAVDPPEVIYASASNTGTADTYSVLLSTAVTTGASYEMNLPKPVFSGPVLAVSTRSDGYPDVFIPPTSNPGIAGAVWNNAGTLAISAG